MPLLQDFTRCRRSLYQSFPLNKESLKDIAVALGFPSKAFLVIGEEDGREGGIPWDCMDNKFTAIPQYLLHPSPSQFTVPNVMETSSVMFGFTEDKIQSISNNGLH